MSSSSTQPSVGSQTSAFIGSGASDVQLAMAIGGAGLQRVQAARIFVNPASIEASGHLLFDCTTTFKMDTAHTPAQH